MFNTDSIEQKCEDFNKFFNEIMGKIETFVQNLPEEMDDNTKNQVEKMKNHCSVITDTCNLFHSNVSEDFALNKLWDVNAVQAITRILLPLNAILKTKTGNSIKYAKQEAFNKAKEQPIIQKAKYVVCKYYDQLSDEGKKTFEKNNKVYTLASTGLELNQLCHKQGENIITTPSSDFKLFFFIDSAMHQVATNLNLLNENEKFDITKYLVKFDNQPILINNQEATAQQIINIVNDKKVDTTKVTISQPILNQDGFHVQQNNQVQKGKVEKTLAELIQNLLQKSEDKK